MSILLISWLLGERGIVGYISGLNLIAIHLKFLDIIKIHIVRNLRIYNECNVLILIFRKNKFLNIV